MLNRRKQSHNTDDDIDPEYKALLATSRDIPHEGSVNQTSDNIIVITAQSRANDDAISYPRQAPKLRKAKDDRTYDSGNVSPTNGSASKNAPVIISETIKQYHHPHGDGYELSRLNANNSIDCSINVGESRNKQQTNYIYYNIQPGDTLQNLSVKYSCPIASIKRLNNIWSDQDFFGLSRIRLPVGKLRLIETVINQDEQGSLHNEQRGTLWNSTNHGNPMATHSNQPYTPPTLPKFSWESDRQIISPDVSGLPNGCVDRVRTDSLFKDLDMNIEKARVAARSYDNNASAIMQTLAQNGDIYEDLSEANMLARREAETLLNDLSDFGLSYNFLLLFIFIFCLVCPLAYVIYLEETHHNNLSHNHHDQASVPSQVQGESDLMNKAHFDP